MKKKGLSFEEKRKRMLDIFKQDQSFFHINDIQKLSVKKGIIFQVVKDVLDSLVGDNLVETDRIGASSFYWALPSKMYQAKKNALIKNRETIVNLENEVQNLEAYLKEQKVLRKETKERSQMIESLEQLKNEKELCNLKIKEYQKNDPERYQNLISDTKLLNEMTENWKDNIYVIEQWLRSKDPTLNIYDLFPDLEQLKLFD